MTETHSAARELPRTAPATVDPRFAALLLIGNACLVVISIVVTWFLYVRWSGPQAMQSEARHLQTAPRTPANAAPLSVIQREERRDYENRQKELLTSYGWIDRKQGIARIPLELAMERYLASREAKK